MFKKILIANRGEIAVRIIRACREMGIQTVAVFSEADRDSLHVRLADGAICIGPGPAKESYLSPIALLSAAEISGADAVHPGYGFLAENNYFAEQCLSMGLHFIGPTQESIRKMGDKVEARRIMRKYGVPVTPGSEGCVKAEDPKLFKIARNIGYPILVKARAGGGGRGMRVVRAESEIKGAISSASSEAQAAFANGDVYLEKYFENPRHIEFQILGDEKGDAVSFPERDCTIQRRHQKLIEESPSPALSAKMRKKMGHVARLVTKAVDYVTVGTVEFLLDENQDFYFMEMNTRIQVEHPVTEMVSGVDLIKEQIRLAAGDRIGYDTDEVEIRGHAMECRINAEDPERDFAPCPGKVERFIVPGGPAVRVDSHCYSGYQIPPYYDSLLAKLIVMGRSRASAINRMQRALHEFIVEGVATTIPFHKKVMQNESFRRGEIGTNFVEEYFRNHAG